MLRSHLPIFCVLALLGLGAVSTSVHAAFIITLQQSGNDVVATGSGTLNTSAFSDILVDGSSGAGVLLPFEGHLDVGPTTENPQTPQNVYEGGISGPGVISGPGSFGDGGNTFASSGGGDAVALVNTYPGFNLYAPDGYVSGAPLSDTSTWTNATINSLGVTPGTYTWTWGAGPTADSFTLEVAVPEPAPAGLFLLLFSLFLSRRRQNRGGHVI